MSSSPLLILYIIMLFLQTIHIFEEIASKAYELVGSLNKYLLVASVLLFVSYLALILILMEVRLGYLVAVFSALLALGNGIIHLIGYIRTKSYTATLGSGVFSGIPLGIVGGLVLMQLFSQIRW